LKRTDLLDILKAMGVCFMRHGGKHDWYENPKTKAVQPIPRHKEINEQPLKALSKN